MSYKGPYNRGDKSEEEYLSRANHTGTQTLATISDAGTMAAESADGYVSQTGVTGAAQLPVGTTLQRPEIPTEGMLRRNSETGNLEEYTGTSWEVVGSGGVNTYSSKAIGELFALWDHLTGVEIPSNNGDVKFIKLTANDSYNDGLLINEVVSGSAPLVEAEAEIAVGPLTGQVVPLINTEQRFLRAGASGVKQMDQMQRMTGQFGEDSGASGVLARSSETFTNSQGVFEGSQRLAGTGTTSGGDLSYGPLKFDSTDSPDARASSTTDGETRPKNITATYYMRII